MDYTYEMNPSTMNVEGLGEFLAVVGPIIAVIFVLLLAVAIVVAIAMWKAFKKAGKPGWASIVPIYNTIVLVQIAKVPTWYLAFLFAPVLGFIPVLGQLLTITAIVFGFIINVKIAKQFGKTGGFGIGLSLVPVVFWPILGFGKAQYQSTEPVVAPIPQAPTTPPVATPPTETPPPTTPPVTPTQ
jgi:hypothetical protein